MDLKPEVDLILLIGSAAKTTGKNYMETTWKKLEHFLRLVVFELRDDWENNEHARVVFAQLALLDELGEALPILPQPVQGNIDLRGYNHPQNNYRGRCL